MPDGIVDVFGPGDLLVAEYLILKFVKSSLLLIAQNVMT
jgi:hypothetical protein